MARQTPASSAGRLNSRRSSMFLRHLGWASIHSVYESGLGRAGGSNSGSESGLRSLLRVGNGKSSKQQQQQQPRAQTPYRLRHAFFSGSSSLACMGRAAKFVKWHDIFTVSY